MRKMLLLTVSLFLLACVFTSAVVSSGVDIPPPFYPVARYAPQGGDTDSTLNLQPEANGHKAQP